MGGEEATLNFEVFCIDVGRVLKKRVRKNWVIDRLDDQYGSFSKYLCSFLSTTVVNNITQSLTKVRRKQRVDRTQNSTYMLYDSFGHYVTYGEQLKINNFLPFFLVEKLHFLPQQGLSEYILLSYIYWNIILFVAQIIVSKQRGCLCMYERLFNIEVACFYACSLIYFFLDLPNTKFHFWRFFSLFLTT